MDMLLTSGPRPEVIVIQEAWQAMYGVYIDELQKQTGQTWYGAFATLCAPGNWNGSACTSAWFEGIGIFGKINRPGILAASGSEPLTLRQLGWVVASELRLKRTPALTFLHDDTVRRAARVEELLGDEGDVRR